MDEQKIRNAIDQGSKEFTIVFWITEGGCVPVKAETLPEAIKKLKDYLSFFAKDAALSRRFSVANREWEILKEDSGQV